LEKIQNSKFDVIILDVNMPVMNGKDFLVNIRNKKISTPVIALTSDSMLQDKLEMFELGIDDYLTKPFEIEELIARLKSLLKRKDKEIDDEKTA
jgi:DNA-binding response OmpR family regulator